MGFSREIFGRGISISAALAVALLGVGGCGGAEPDEQGRYSVEPVTVDGLRLPARVAAGGIELATNGGFEPRFWPGVNLGATVPARSPGEVAVRGPRYREWFRQMGEVGIRAIRVYTLLDPSFYQELEAYNEAHPDAPLYVIHGIWIPEERFLETGDLWDREVLAEQRRLTDEVYAATAGQLEAPERLGEASGRWTADIRRWIVAWSLGIELEPQALAQSERHNAPRSYDGELIKTRGRASSTEAWLARQLDYLSSLDAKDGFSRPITFTNWLTLDPLDHPTEPLRREDLVSVDATKLRATDAWPGGLFASYHAYPYYPDFLRYEYEDADDPYRAYLRELRRHHRGQAVMITEFGVPSSLGKAHLGPLGRDQGDHPEAEAMAIDAEMLRIIRDEGFAGGIVFEWIDEWFKLTWNTVETELPPDRRQLWRNALTNEEHFGLLAAEAGLEEAVTIDGDDGEWESKEAPSQVIWEAPDGLRQIRVAHDEAYLYLTMRFDDDTDADGAVIGLDVREGANGGLPWVEGASMPGAEVAIGLGPEEVELRRAAWTDAFPFQYGTARGYVEVDPAELRPGSGAWNRPRLILNRPYEIPTRNETSEIEVQDLGTADWVGEPEDSRSLAQRDSGVVELRVPWALLGFSDPSSRTLTRPQLDGRIETETLPPSRGVEIAVFGPGGEPLSEPAAYNWEPWQSVRFSERRKAGLDRLAEAFAETAAEPPAGE